MWPCHLPGMQESPDDEQESTTPRSADDGDFDKYLEVRCWELNRLSTVPLSPAAAIVLQDL